VCFSINHAGPRVCINKCLTVPKVIFVERDGNRKTVESQEGLSLLEVAHNNNVDLEGACGGSLACSTCHLIVEPSWFPKLDPASEDEEDMLDLAFGLTNTSRLGCQIILTEELDGIEVKLPSGSRNFKIE
jgi:ferredoxin